MGKKKTNNDNDGDWKHTYIDKLEKNGGNLIFESNTCEKDFYEVQHKGSKFLSDIVQSWSTIHFNNNPDNINNQILWNNSFIKKDNKLIYYKKWYDKGIKILNTFLIKDKNIYIHFSR